MSYLSNIHKWYAMSDLAIIQEIGKHLKKKRLKNNLTQQELASKVGLFRSTISEIENGRISSVLSLIQILRGLNNFDALEGFALVDEISPLYVAEQQAKYGKRATSKKQKTKPQSEW